MVVDVQNLNADFLVASSLKMCGPTGVGFLYGKSDILSARPPFLGGGEMMSDVFFIIPPTADPPSRRFLLNIYTRAFNLSPSVRIYGPAPSEHVFRAALCSFNVEEHTPYRSSYFSSPTARSGYRSGHHCAQPLHRHLGDSASARASPHLYNTVEDMDDFTRALNDSQLL